MGSNNWYVINLYDSWMGVGRCMTITITFIGLYPKKRKFRLWKKKLKQLMKTMTLTYKKYGFSRSISLVACTIAVNKNEYTRHCTWNMLKPLSKGFRNTHTIQLNFIIILYLEIVKLEYRISKFVFVSQTNHFSF